MGTRLEVKFIDNADLYKDDWYGTKMCGYTDANNLECLKYLKSLNRDDINDFFWSDDLNDTYFGYSSRKIRLTAVEFEKFIRLYEEDYRKHGYDGDGSNRDNFTFDEYDKQYPSLYTPMKEIIKDRRDKLISWDN